MTTTKNPTADLKDLGPIPNLGYSNIGGTKARDVHTTSNQLLRAALAGLPDYVTQLNALRELERCQAPEVEAGEAQDLLSTRLVRQLLAGEPAPTDLGGQAVELAIATQSRNVVATAIEQARDTLAAELDQIVLDHADEILETLHGHLQRAVDQATTLAKAGPVQRLLDSETAIRDDRVDALAQFHELCATNAAVRGAQAQIMRAVAGIGGDHSEWRELAIFRDVLSVFGQYTTWHRHGYLVTRHEGHQRPLAPPWPHGYHARQQIGRDAATADFFAWSIDSGADLWVPTSSQLAAADEAMRRAADNLPDDGRSELMDPSAYQALKHPLPRARAGA